MIMSFVLRMYLWVKWLVINSAPRAMSIRLLLVGLLSSYFGLLTWATGIFFVLGMPLRNFDDWVSNFFLARHIPGPRVAKVTRLWKTLSVLRGDFQDTLLDMHRQYGTVVQIGPKEYSISDPTPIDQIYKGAGGGFRKADWYSCCTPPEAEAQSLFSVRNRERHQYIRKLLAPYYRKLSVQRYQPLLDPTLEELQTQLDEAATSEQSVDLANIMELYAFDAIGRITTSNSFGGLRGDATPVKFLDALHVALRYFAVVGDFSEWHPLLFSIVPYLGSLNGLRVVNQFIEDQIQLRLQTGPDKSLKVDMMSDFMPYALGDPDPKRVFASLRHLSETNILPGADTTATAMCAILFYLSRSSGCTERLRKELEEAPAGGADKLRDLSSLSYLDAVVKEAMRLHPPVGMMNPRVVPEGGATVCGYYFPNGSIVGMNAFALHHNLDIWGPDHEDFRPERWLEDGDKQRLERAFFSWGAGSRECIGKHVGLLGMLRTIEYLILRYDFEIEDQDVSWANFQFTQFSKMVATIRMRPTQ